MPFSVFKIELFYVLFIIIYFLDFERRKECIDFTKICVFFFAHVYKNTLLNRLGTTVVLRSQVLSVLNYKSRF